MWRYCEQLDVNKLVILDEIAKFLETSTCLNQYKRKYNLTSTLLKKLKLLI